MRRPQALAGRATVGVPSCFGLARKLKWGLPMKTLRLVAAVVSVVLPLAAVAQEAVPLAMPVGSTTTLALPAPVSKVTVREPELVEATVRGRKLVLVGLGAGRTEVVVKTSSGEQRFSVYVAVDKYALPY